LPQDKKPKKKGSREGAKGETEETIALRPLTTEDLKQAKDQVICWWLSLHIDFCHYSVPNHCASHIMQVGPSFASQGIVMNEIKQWNELYGKGGSRKKEELTYFL
jgi:hypothetical protein